MARRKRHGVDFQYDSNIDRGARDYQRGYKDAKAAKSGGGKPPKKGCAVVILGGLSLAATVGNAVLARKWGVV